MPDPRQPANPSIAGFEIRSILGEGPGVVVYRAEDRKLRRPVALKLLTHAADGAAGAGARFLREARSAAALNHPNICTIYRIGEVDDDAVASLGGRPVLRGTPFVAMELIRGDTLATTLASSGPLPLPQLLDVGRQIASALVEANRRGIVHGGLRPGKVMLDSDGRVKVLDFGLTRAADAVGETAAATADTLPGTKSATAAYVSPEQLEDGPLDTRSDVYALGVLLYELATTRLPIGAGSGARNLDAEVARLRGLRPDLPPEFEGMVLGCLERRAEDRPQIDDLLDGLTTLASPEVPLVSAATAPAVTAVRARHRPGPWMFAALVAVAIGVAAWLVGRLPSAPAPPRSVVAVLPIAGSGQDFEATGYVTAGVAQSLIRRLDGAGLPVIPWTTASRFSGTTEAPAQVARHLQIDKLLTLVVTGEGDIVGRVALIDGKSGLTEWSRDFAAEEDDLLEIPREMALAIAVRLATQLTPGQRERLSSSDSASVEAWDLYMQGVEAFQANDPELHVVALRYFDRALELDPALTDALVGRGAVRSSRFWYGWGGLEDWRLAEQDFKAALRRDPVSMAARRGLIRLYWFQGRAEQCLGQGREARTLGQDGSLETLMTRGEALMFGSLPDLAVPLFDRVIGIDPWNVGGHWLRVVAAVWAGDHGATMAFARAYLEQFGPNPQVLMYLGEALYRVGEVDEARRLLEEALLRFDDDPNASLFLIGNFFEAIERPRRAREIWTAGVAYLEDQLARSPESALARTDLVFLLALLGDRDGFEREKSVLLAQVPAWGTALAGIGYGHLQLGDVDEGIDFIRRSVRLGTLEIWREETPGMIGLDDGAPRTDDLREELQAMKHRLRSLYGPQSAVSP